MIDIRKALSQRCYIIFDSNEQLRKFFEDNQLVPYVGIGHWDKVLSVHENGEVITLDEIILNLQEGINIPRYHHTELTITDDGE